VAKARSNFIPVLFSMKLPSYRSIAFGAMRGMLLSINHR
jgi:hypothetical protein